MIGNPSIIQKGVFKRVNIGKIFQRQRYVILFACVAALLWGVGYSCVKIGYECFSIAAGDVPSKLLFAGVRFFLAGIMAIIFSWALTKKGLPAKKDWKGIWILSFFQTILQYSMLYIALATVSGSKSSILNQLGPFLLVLLSHFVDKNDRFSFGKALGCLLGFSGIILVNFGNGFDWNFSFIGEGFIVLSSLSAAAGYIVSKKLTKNGGAILLTGYQQLVGGIILIVVGLLSGGTLYFDSWKDIALLLYLSFSISAAYSIWSLLLQYNEISKISIYKFAVPVFGVFSSGLLLGEEIWSMKTLFSLLLVAFGIIAVNYQHQKKDRKIP